MKFRLTLMLLLLLLAVTPLAQAVDCIMVQPTHAAAPAMEHCPMMRAATPLPHTAMSVAECFELKSLAEFGVNWPLVVAYPTKTPSLTAILPQALLVRSLHMVPVRSGAPLQYREAIRDRRVVLAISGRLLI